nr:HAMP domain-containing sensor histidine kinase [Aliidiomarina quisquiliarum]
MASFKDVAVNQSSGAFRDIFVHEYIDNVIRSLKPRLKEKAIALHVDCDKGLKARFQAGALAQILTNMILNSYIHGFDNKTNGCIHIHVHLEPDSTSNGMLHFVYEDDGIGLSSDQLEHLFDPFFTTKADRGGSGLGAHIIYTLIHDTLAGSLQVSSHQGKGLKYEFSFPVNLLGDKPTDSSL